MTTKDEARQRMDALNRIDGDWKTWFVGGRDDSAGQYAVGWVPWRSDAREVTLLEAPSSRDANIIKSVLTATEARLPPGFKFERRDDDV